MTAGIQEHGPECLSCTLEKVPRNHAEGNHKEGDCKNAHGPGRKLDELRIVRCKRCHECFGLPHEDCPGDKHETARINKGELERFLDAGVEARTVVVADNRLRAVNESEERQNDNRNDAVGNAESRNGHVATRKCAYRLHAHVSVGGQAPGEYCVHQAIANLHYRRRQT